jgi:hypothetical protein
MEEIKVEVSSDVLAALDDFARVHGLSRAQAARMMLSSAPEVAHALLRAPVSGRDVLGP